jgi:large repetitive protein
MALMLVPTVASAAGTPNISLEKKAPKKALIGTQQQVTLIAHNPAGEIRGYNLTFRDVLPKGVEYVAGSSSVAPRILEDEPAEGETTLLFENVADLSASSEYALTYEVKPSTTFFTISGEKTRYTNHAEDFVSQKPRKKPTANAKGEIVSGFKGDSAAEATTELTAVEIEKSEPSPEGEILRGVHEHQTVYTLTIRNNKVGPTSNLEVEDWLPAGLEFLGCGETENTTETKTNPLAAAPEKFEEYAGSGPIEQAAPPSAPECDKHLPWFVATEEHQFEGEAKPAVFTHVKWKGLGALAPGAELKLQYVAAIPILQNSMSWLGAEPSPESLGQIANLNNNQGPETFDEEPLVNHAEVLGEYEEEEGKIKVPVSAEGELTRTAEDLAIQKSVTPSEIEQGGESIWTLNVETSEYRYVNGIEIDDTLPNGLCPLGAENFEGPVIGKATEPLEECDPEAGVEPTYEIVGSGEGPQPAPYTTVEEQANGTFKIHWDDSTVKGALTQMKPSEHLIIKFPTRTRTHYQENFESTTPVLTGDSWTNHVETQGENFARCSPGDPTCEGVGEKIFTEEEEGKAVFDVSEASQQAGGVTIDKTVRENDGNLVPEDCEGPKSEYVEGLVSKTEPKLPLYGPGDEICWTLRVDFASKLFAGHPVVTDFVPSDEEYVEGSAFAVEPTKFPEGENSIPATFNDEFENEKESLQWELGEAVESGSQVFEWRFRTKVKKEPKLAPEEITGNLMKFVYSDTEGQTFPLRDRAEVERQEPEIELAKGITAVGGTGVPGGFAPEATAHGGEVVSYALKLSNTGNEDAQETEVWDVLPEGVECSDVVAKSISDGGACEEGRIVWTGLAVAEAGTTTVTYQVELPTDYGSAHLFTNEAGVTHYKTPTNTGEEFEYIPAENINPKAGEPNTEPILAEAKVTTAVAELKKRATTETTQGGNGASEATIGEIVDYEVEATTPEGSILYGTPTVTESVPSNLEFLGVTSHEINGEPFSSVAGMELEETATGFVVHFPAEYVNPAGSGTDVVLVKFKARVKNLAINKRGVTITNHAAFEFEDKEEGAATELTAQAQTPVVEPNIKVEKSQSTSPTKTVSPGETILYKVTAKNPTGTGVSTADEVELVDTVPAGMEVETKSVEESGGTVVGSTIVWKVGSIVPGGSVSKTYKLKVEEPATAASSFENKVVGTTQSLADVGGVAPTETREAGFTEGAYESSSAGYEAEATEKVRLVGASVSKEVSRPTGTIGNGLTYTLHMNLPPAINFYDTTMVDTLPNGVGFDGLVSAKCVKGCEGTVEGKELTAVEGSGGTTLLGWYFGNFAAGEARELVVVFKAHIADEKNGGGKVVAEEELTNSVVGLYDETPQGEPAEGKTPTPGEGNNSFSEETNVAHAMTEVVEPNVTLSKGVSAVPALVGGVAAEPNSKLTYTLTVGNTGGSTAYEVEVTDTNTTANLRNVTPVEGASLVKSAAGEPLRWVIPEIESGGSVTLTYTAELLESEELEADEEIHNTAEVPLYFGLPEPERGEAPVFREYEGPSAEKDIEVALPKIGVVKTTGEAGFPDSATTEVGAEFPWRVVVKNESAVAGAKAVSVTDNLPAGWEYVAGSTEYKAVGSAVLKPAADPEQPSGEPGTLIWKEVASSLPATASVEVFFKANPTTAATPGANLNSATGAFEDLTGSPGGEGTPYEATDTAEAELIAPELAIEKTPDGGETVAGTADHYDIKVSNNGTGPANAVQVTDVLRPGQEFVGPATATPATGFEEESVEEDKPAAGETTIVWTIAQIPAGSSVTIRVPIVTPASLAEEAEITDIATASAPQQAEEPSDEGSFIVHREADLKIEKEADRPNINGGEKINYKLTAKNLGPSDASGVAVADHLPDGTTFVKAEPGANCSFDEPEDEVTCNVGELAVGAKAEFHVEVEVVSGRTEPVTNTAEVSGNEKDPELGNNTKTVETPIGGSADLKILKTGPSAPVLLGNEFTYTLEVKNEGPSDAGAVKVVDPLPAEVEFVEATAPVGTTCAAVANTLTCELGTFVRNATPVVIEVTVKATGLSPAGGKTVNTATVESPTTDPEPGNDESTAEVEIVPAADLALTKTAPATVEPNGDLTYNLKVENLGPSGAHGVTVTDPLPAGVELELASMGEGCFFSDQSAVVCELGPPGAELAVGETAEFQFTVHVPFALGGKTISNTASVEAEEGDPNPENNTDTATTTVGPAADLSITKTMGAAQAGKPLTYTLAITNNGPSTSSAVTVKDTLPAGTTFQSAAPSQGTCAANGQAVTCQLGPLASGASAQVSITVEVSASAGGTLRNTATVEGPEPDPNKSNNESSVEGPIAPAPPSAPNLKVVKTASTSTPEVGVPFTYDVAVTNLSGATAKNVKVVDTLNGPVVVGAVKPESGSCHVKGSKIECSIPQIPVGKTVHIRYTVTAKMAGKLSNTASAEAANGETAPANNHAVKGVTAKSPTGSFKLTKTASRKVVPGGGKVGFTITLRNGSKALTEATICDRLPAALVFVKAAGAKFVNGEACWTKAYVAAHKTLTLHLTARAVNGYKTVHAKNVATAVAANAKKRSASATVRIEPSFAGAPGGVTG